MKKSIVAGAIALALGTAGAANALTVNVTNMSFDGVGSFGATGEIDSTGSGSFTGTGTFLGHPWTADAQAYFSGTGAYNWSVTGSNAINDSIPIQPSSYDFNLTANQVAWGMLFDWSTNFDIPVLAIMTCTGFDVGGICTGTGTPIQYDSFAGVGFVASGIVTSSSAPAFVPVPAAAWLLGSGLLGLVGVARRRKQS